MDLASLLFSLRFIRRFCAACRCLHNQSAWIRRWNQSALFYFNHWLLFCIEGLPLLLLQKKASCTLVICLRITPQPTRNPKLTQKPKSRRLRKSLEEVEIRGVHGNNQNRKTSTPNPSVTIM